MQPIIRIDDVHFTYPAQHGDPVLALDGVTPAVGARVVLLFVNGGRVGVILGTVQG